MPAIDIQVNLLNSIMASGDSSQCTVSTHFLPVLILMQGDESPDRIYAVPTEKTALILLNSITASAIALKPASMIPDAAMFAK